MLERFLKIYHRGLHYAGTWLHYKALMTVMSHVSLYMSRARFLLSAIKILDLIANETYLNVSVGFGWPVVGTPVLCSWKLFPFI